MSREVLHRLTYDAPPERVAAMLRDADFRREVCTAIGMSRAEVSVSVPEDSDSAEIVLDQWQPTASLPAFARKLVGEETHIVQTESWAGAARGDIVVTIPGKPGDMSGTAVLTEEAGVTTETVALTITVGVPLVGGKIEALIGDMLLDALKTENRLGRDYLSR
ncbi:DUF2505 domain-containing protein [Nocardioides sp. cx-169]|uniref:DUF2505 domain-containing protein n=1 Tax=Nocardioides sp. cx-169 TaxID=2899080 RepID=UPI001E4D4FED|nr:DUF2505 domain-containing protein [Nocardioides sp. cx-169]MCD4533912.1 DUF2505 domain-containing protein [Nocardioides sp. cx-169]